MASTGGSCSLPASLHRVLVLAIGSEAGRQTGPLLPSQGHTVDPSLVVSPRVTVRGGLCPLGPAGLQLVRTEGTRMSRAELRAVQTPALHAVTLHLRGARSGCFPGKDARGVHPGRQSQDPSQQAARTQQALTAARRQGCPRAPGVPHPRNQGPPSPERSASV